MERPGAIYVPALYAGDEVGISWDPVPGADNYTLQRSADGGEYVQLYDGPGTEYTDTVPEAATAEYRVCATAETPYTWEEIEAMHLTWSEWDAQGGFWRVLASEWTSSGPLEIAKNTPPAISGQDEDLGGFFEVFSVPFTVTDDDPGAEVDVAVSLDESIIQRYNPIALGQEYAVTITNAQISEMETGSRHTITILATDNLGATATRQYTFTVTEDYVTGAVFYVLRDGIPIAKLTTERTWTDYMAAGTHTYQVRGVDETGSVSDSNEVTITLELNETIIAPVDDPEDMMALYVRRGERPETLRTLTFPNMSEMLFEGREYPVVVGKRAKRRTFTLSFSHLTWDEQEFMGRMLDQTVIYRDRFGNRLFAEFTNQEEDLVSRNVAPHIDTLIDFTAALVEVSHSEEIPYD